MIPRTRLLQLALSILIAVVVVACLVAILWLTDNWVFWAAVAGVAAFVFTLTAWKWRRHGPD